MLHWMNEGSDLAFAKQNNHPDDDEVRSSWKGSCILFEKNLKSLRGNNNNNDNNNNNNNKKHVVMLPRNFCQHLRVVESLFDWPGT